MHTHTSIWLFGCGEIFTLYLSRLKHDMKISIGYVKAQIEVINWKTYISHKMMIDFILRSPLSTWIYANPSMYK